MAVGMNPAAELAERGKRYGGRFLTQDAPDHEMPAELDGPQQAMRLIKRTWTWTASRNGTSRRS